MIRAPRRQNLVAAGISGGINPTTTKAAAAVLAFEQHFSPAELGKLWHLSPHFIRQRFKDEPGVIRIDRPEEMHKRGYLTIRIPVSVAQRVHQQLRAA